MMLVELAMLPVQALKTYDKSSIFELVELFDHKSYFLLETRMDI